MALGGTGQLVAWTLQDARHAATWDAGIGAATYGGRWNSIGRHVLYAAMDPATAILEVAVHKGFKALNTVAHTLHGFTITDPAAVHVLHPEDLPNPHWLHPIPPHADQQAFGDALVDTHPFVLLPSAVSAHSWNLLVNVATARPLMAQRRSERFALDPRLRAAG
ncbi:RES family NAD+ phosphorylase [Piscinibacter sakaiensis]|uniref:RES family NAD+ phosphorylase n=1 Tax=Piscinibacter sakaiensis TaxID=1547922 RepID=UPI00372D41AD